MSLLTHTHIHTKPHEITQKINKSPIGCFKGLMFDKLWVIRKYLET